MLRRAVLMVVMLALGSFLAVAAAQAHPADTYPANPLGHVVCHALNGRGHECGWTYYPGCNWNHGEQGHNSHENIGYIPGLTCSLCLWRVVGPYHHNCGTAFTAYNPISSTTPVRVV